MASNQIRGVRRPRRTPALVAVAAIVAIGLVAVWTALPHARSGGPLARGTSYRDRIPTQVGQLLTWGIVLPDNRTVSAAVVERIEPDRSAGLEVVGVLVHRPDSQGAVGQAVGFPPAGLAAFEPSGAALPPVGTPDNHLEALFGVRLLDAAGGSINGLRISYRHDGIEYVDVVPYSLDLFVVTR